MAPSDLKPHISTKRHLKVQIYITDKQFSILFIILFCFQVTLKLKKRVWGHNGPLPSGNVSQKASQHLTNLGGEIFSRLDSPKTSKANEIIFSPINTNISRNKVISFGKPSSIAVRMAEEFQVGEAIWPLPVRNRVKFQILYLQ